MKKKRLPNTHKEDHFEGYERRPQELPYEKEEDKDTLDYSTQFDKRNIKDK
jgi:hypothetical protein